MWHIIHNCWPFQIWTLVNLVKPLQYGLGDIHASPPGDCSNQQIGEMFHILFSINFLPVSWQYFQQQFLASFLSIFVLFLASFLAMPKIFSWTVSFLAIFFRYFIKFVYPMFPPPVSCVFPGNASWFHFWFSSRLCCCRSASGLVTIPDICHFFTLAYFKVWKILHSKVRKFATKIASRRNSVNHHTVCKITHCV